MVCYERAIVRQRQDVVISHVVGNSMTSYRASLEIGPSVDMA